jgi:hypothetical protein
MIIKALSLKQPYANLIAEGKKTIETRSWTTRYRGDILICASQSGAGEPKGVALCIVELTDIRPMIPDDASAACVDIYPRAQAWIISNLRVLKKPFPVKGQLGLFDVVPPDDL